MSKFWGGAAWLFTIILGALVNKIVPENWVYITGFIFGAVSITILIASKDD